MKKQALALIFANGVNFLVNFAMNPFMARQLSYEDNGTYSQVSLVNGYALVLFGLGISSILNLLFSEYKKDLKLVMSTTFWIQFVSGILCTLLIFFLRDGIGTVFENKQLPYYLMLYLPSTFFMVLTNLSLYYFIYYNKARQLSILTISLNLLKIAVTFYAINYLHSLFYAIVFQNIVNAIQLILHMLLLRKEMFPIKKPNWENIRYTLKLSYPYLAMAIIGYSILTVNGIIVSNQLGLTEYAIYRNGAIEIPFIATLYSSITAVALPQIVEYARSNRLYELMVLKRQISNTVAAVVYPVVFFCILNANEFMSLYLGDKYLRSGAVFGIYNIALLVRINSYSDILTIYNKPTKILIPNIISLASGIGANFVLIKFLGINGAAIAFVISLLIFSLLLISSTCREIGISWKTYFDLKTLGSISAISFSGALLTVFFSQKNIFAFCISGFIYFVGVYFLLLKFKMIDINLIPEKLRNIVSKLYKTS
ncbi:MAG: hypothetical protein EOP48_13045 [Sphingobacteriales bacterium]|nr:MAG: hypothetical protein EOP48_13045 [Sphingobacteriales bacterium]